MSDEPMEIFVVTAPGLEGVLADEAREKRTPTPEELALTMEIETEMDLEVIEMLDWLETLGEIDFELIVSVAAQSSSLPSTRSS